MNILHVKIYTQFEDALAKIFPSTLIWMPQSHVLFMLCWKGMGTPFFLTTNHHGNEEIVKRENHHHLH